MDRHRSTSSVSPGYCCCCCCWSSPLALARPFPVAFKLLPIFISRRRRAPSSPPPPCVKVLAGMATPFRSRSPTRRHVDATATPEPPPRQCCLPRAAAAANCWLLRCVHVFAVLPPPLYLPEFEPRPRRSRPFISEGPPRSCPTELAQPSSRRAQWSWLHPRPPL